MGLVFSWLWDQREPVPPLLAVTTETQVVPPAEAPVAAPVEIEIQTEEITATEQTHDVCEPKTEVETEAVVAVTCDIAIPEAVTKTTEVVEAPTSDQVPAEAEPVAEEVVTEAVEEVEPQQETEAVASPDPAEGEVDDAEIEVLAEEDAPEVLAEHVAISEDAAPSVEIPVVPDTVPEALVEEAEALVTEVKESIADCLVDDFVVTESVSVVDAAIAESAAESAAVQSEIVEVSDTKSESMDVMPAEPVAALAEEMALDINVEQICSDMLSEEPKAEICDMPCQMQLAVESVQLGSMETSMEATLNGHMNIIVPEVSIEG